MPIVPYTPQPFIRRAGSRGRRRVTVALTAVAAGAALLSAGAVANATAAGHRVTATTAPAALTAPAAAAAARPSRDVIANLFEWNWNSVSTECRTVLGPGGYGGVQVAPPQDSIMRTALGNGSDTVLHPWWEVYQPTDYGLTSRMGDEAQFKSMVTTCRRAGVKVYVDAVINHMTGQGSVSYGGKTFGRYDYPGLYGPMDFHKYSGDCPSASGAIEDFNNLQQVRNCELVGLADLRTDIPSVRAKIAAYLNKLLRYGVSGFRVDAAKHIGQPDLAAIKALLHNTKDGTRPYLALEVFGGGPGILSPQAFTTVGSVLGLDADKQIRDAFKSYPDAHVGSIATLKIWGADAGLPPSNRTLTFVQNHDTERNGDALSYKDGATNTIANVFLLAYGYGRPQVYASFKWNVADDSPPSDANGNGMITDTNCRTTWACVDRQTAVFNMVAWHNQAGKTARRHWYDDGQNLIAFSRGKRAWVAINNATRAKTVTVQTGMAAGTYCDVIHSVHTRGTCTGQTVTVNALGRATVRVPAKSAVAFDRTNRIG